MMCGEGKKMWTEIAAALNIPRVYAMASSLYLCSTVFCSNVLF